MSAAGIPQIAAVLGSCTAGGAYVPAMSDETVIVREQGTIFLGGPPLVKAATGEVVSAEELGGGDLHARTSGVVDHLADDDAHALRIVRSIVATLGPRSAAPWERRPVEPPAVDPATLYGAVPPGTRTPYDPRELIARLARRQPPARVQAALRHDRRLRLRARPRPPGRHRSPTRGSSSARARSRPPTSSSSATSAACRCCSCRTSAASWSAASTRRAASPRTARSWSARSRRRACRS